MLFPAGAQEWQRWGQCPQGQWAAQQPPNAQFAEVNGLHPQPSPEFGHLQSARVGHPQSVWQHLAAAVDANSGQRHVQSRHAAWPGVRDFDLIYIGCCSTLYGADFSSGRSAMGLMNSYWSFALDYLGDNRHTLSYIIHLSYVILFGYYT